MTVENDAAKGMELFEKNCKELNVSDSCLALGNIFLTSKSKEPENLLLSKNSGMIAILLRGAFKGLIKI